MVDVDCKCCPIRNFCKVYGVSQDHVPVFCDKCPLFKCAQQTREFFNADEKLAREGR